jgi:type II secretory pathway pseudopilin PulG
LNRSIILVIILFVGFLTSCLQSVDYTILDEETVNNMTAISAYVDELQSCKLEYKGYKVFDTSDGNKVVIISLD